MLTKIDHGPIRELRLERPPVNALSPELIAALDEAVRGVGTDVGALVLSGREGMFSAGLDIPEFLGLERAEVRSAWQAFFELMRAIVGSPVPVAAALTGHAPAGGCVLALCCEQRIMADGPYQLGLNEVQVGVAVPPPILALTRHVLGRRQAERLCTSALLVDAAEAHRIGLVDELVPPTEVVPRALAWAEGLLALPPRALARTRAFVRGELMDALALPDAALDRLIDDWFADETQGALRAVMERLAKKR